MLQSFCVDMDYRRMGRKKHEDNDWLSMLLVCEFKQRVIVKFS
jgi:hypothetical protein